MEKMTLKCRTEHMMLEQNSSWSISYWRVSVIVCVCVCVCVCAHVHVFLCVLPWLSIHLIFIILLSVVQLHLCPVQNIVLGKGKMPFSRI
jgi:hypothetical protein